LRINQDIESPCRKTSDWGFVGYYAEGGEEHPVPIGVYSDWKLGKASANAWMRNESRAVRWEAFPMYEELEDE